MTLVFAVLLGLLSSLPTGLRAVIDARQRTGGLAIAGDVLEQARARGYAEVGHDLDSDPTLASDPALTGSGVAWAYTEPEPDEPLASSSVDAGATAATSDNPLYPFSPHRWTTERDGTTYTATVYVTLVRPPNRGPYKRITVLVDWDGLRRADPTDSSVRLTSFLFDAAPGAADVFSGAADATGGSIAATGRLPGDDAVDARVFLPYAHGEVESRFVTEVRGYAATARAQHDGAAGVGADAKAESSADDDNGAAPFEQDRIGPVAHNGAVLGTGSPVVTTLGGGTASSASTARACWVCHGPGPDDDDRLPHHASGADGPVAASMSFAAGAVTGTLAQVVSGCGDDCASAVIDLDSAAGITTAASTATVRYPALVLGQVAGAPPAFAGMVRMDAATVTAEAQAGRSALPPSAGGAPIALQLFDGIGYRDVPITPGVATESTGHAQFPIGPSLVVMDAVVRSTPAAVSASTSGASVTASEAALTSWLQVELHLVVLDPEAVIADLLVLVDYGQVSARATYEEA